MVLQVDRQCRFDPTPNSEAFSSMARLHAVTRLVELLRINPPGLVGRKHLDKLQTLCAAYFARCRTQGDVRRKYEAMMRLARQVADGHEHCAARRFFHEAPSALGMW